MKRHNGRPATVAVKWPEILADLNMGLTVTQAAKKNGVGRASVLRYLKAIRLGEMTLADIERKAAPLRDPKNSSILQQWQSHKKPSPDMPSEWDALLHGDQKFIEINAAGSASNAATRALIGLLQAVQTFLSGESSLSDLGKAATTAEINEVIEKEIASVTKYKPRKGRT